VSAVSSTHRRSYEEGIYEGGEAFGNMTLTSKSIFFGQPLVDAYLLQEELNFYSVVIPHVGSAEGVFQKSRYKLLY